VASRAARALERVAASVEVGGGRGEVEVEVEGAGAGAGLWVEVVGREGVIGLRCGGGAVLEDIVICDSNVVASLDGVGNDGGEESWDEKLGEGEVGAWSLEAYLVPVG